MKHNVKVYCVTLEVDVTVEIDHDKFTEDVRKGYDEAIRRERGLNDHIANIAIEGLLDPFVKFIEGYGETEKVGILSISPDPFDVVSVREDRQ